MKSDSITIRAAILDSLAAILKNHYNESSEVTFHSGDSRLILAEKHDFGNNSHTLGVVRIETAGKGTFLVNVYAGGGRSGLYGIDRGAGDQLVGEMEQILLTVGDAITPDKDKEKYEADLEKAHKYNPYTRSEQERGR
jgi:hypothetical protein